MDPVPFLIGTPLVAWFAWLAYVHLARPARVWAAHARALERKGMAASAEPSAAWAAATRKRGAAFAGLAFVTAIAFAYAAWNLESIRRL